MVTDLYTGAVTGAKFINIEMPVFQKDATFVLSLALRPDYIGRVIADKVLSGRHGWWASPTRTIV